uniref:Protein kinase domain-containing protein n=1 Tax=Daphnia galeata TaxID=27404 RepID=A0A8J2WM18_9CRUS|nr:unnamed protein product [Daphnia galeata]
MKENEGGSTATSIRHRGTVKSDVFTEGLIFGYYLLNGCHPFGSNFHTLPSNILKNDAVNLKKIILQPPQPIHDVIMEMLKSDPVERISSSDVVSRLTNIK